MELIILICIIGAIIKGWESSSQAGGNPQDSDGGGSGGSMAEHFSEPDYEPDYEPRDFDIGDFF